MILQRTRRWPHLHQTAAEYQEYNILHLIMMHYSTRDLCTPTTHLTQARTYSNSHSSDCIGTNLLLCAGAGHPQVPALHDWLVCPQPAFRPRPLLPRQHRAHHCAAGLSPQAWRWVLCQGVGVRNWDKCGHGSLDQYHHVIRDSRYK